MARSSGVRPRKLPAQERSRQTVAAILEAAARILAEEGVAAFNTNRVAGKAGVSVGSLYQYFPNKQALVRSLLGQRVREAEAVRPAALKEGSRASLEEGIRASVGWHVAMHLDNPRLEVALNALAAEVLEPGELEAFEKHYEGAVRMFLERHRERLRIGDPDVAAFLIVQLLHAAPNRALIHHRGALEDGRLSDELSSMILRYLARD